MTLLRRLILCFLLVMMVNGCASFNSYREAGTLPMTGLQQPVTVVRDEKGMPYVYAANLSDAFQAMGFVTAQDRLFQMELTRMVAAGRISELVGEKALPLDRRMRTIGIRRLAERHARLLQNDSAAYFQAYIDGVNTFVERYPEDHHLEFKLSGIQPTLWSMADVLSIMYYMSWSTSANIKTEIITQMLIDRLGPETAAELFPLNINPDEAAGRTPVQPLAPDCPLATRPESDRDLTGYLDDGPLTVGSNNWAVSPERSPGAKPILANDPHLDARILPGPWYPCGLMTPELRIVGAHIPGLPAMPIFRNDALAGGSTSAYAALHDLYVETIDPSGLFEAFFPEARPLGPYRLQPGGTAAVPAGMVSRGRGHRHQGAGPARTAGGRRQGRPVRRRRVPRGRPRRPPPGDPRRPGRAGRADVDHPQT
mgnify:CR=1 FL=1